MSALLRRLGALALTLLAVHLSAFLLLRAARGGPFDEARSLPPAVEAALRAEYHLDEPLSSQYLRALGGALQGDFGPSLRYRDVRVTTILADALPVSASLGFGALLVALLIGIPAGLAAASARRRPLDGIVRGASTVLLSVASRSAGFHLAWVGFLQQAALAGAPTSCPAFASVCRPPRSSPGFRAAPRLRFWKARDHARPKRAGCPHRRFAAATSCARRSPRCSLFLARLLLPC